MGLPSEKTRRFELREVFRMDLTGSPWSATQRTDGQPWHEELLVRVAFIDIASGLVVFEDKVDDERGKRWIAQGFDARGSYWPIPIGQTTRFHDTATVRPIS